eukprot:2069970-Amphidinium_carterae.1
MALLACIAPQLLMSSAWHAFHQDHIQFESGLLSYIANGLYIYLGPAWGLNFLIAHARQLSSSPRLTAHRPLLPSFDCSWGREKFMPNTATLAIVVSALAFILLVLGRIASFAVAFGALSAPFQ